MAEWNQGEAEITYGSTESQVWLTLWQKFIAHPTYRFSDGDGPGLGETGMIYSDDVIPNLMKNEIASGGEGKRYIHFPQNGSGAGTYVNGAFFMVPAGVDVAKMPAAVELAARFCAEDGNARRQMYEKYMTEEDFALLCQNLESAYFLPHFPAADAWQVIGPKFVSDMQAGKPVQQHIAEALVWLDENKMKQNEKGKMWLEKEFLKP